ELPNLGAIAGGTNYGSRIAVEALAGGVVDLGAVTSITDPDGGDSRRRSIDLLAEGPGSRIELAALRGMVDEYSGSTAANADNRYSSLVARDGGTIAAPALGALRGVNVALDATGTLPVAQIERLTDGRLSVAGV